MSDAFFTLDSEWRFTYLNPQSGGRPRASRADLLGKNMWDEFRKASVRASTAVPAGATGTGAGSVRGGYEPLGHTLEIGLTRSRAAAWRSTSATSRASVCANKLRQTQRMEMLGRVTAGSRMISTISSSASRGFAHLGQAASADEHTRLLRRDRLGDEKAGELTASYSPSDATRSFSEGRRLERGRRGLSSLLRQ